jgi:hypothetical protein
MRYAVIIIFLVSVLTSCEKVIDIDLNKADKKYVIEGLITDHAGQCQVTITETKNFDEDNNFSPVTDASVSITDNSTGTITFLGETSPGVYKHASLAGTSGKTYSLRVGINGDTFGASSTIPDPVTMDTIYTTTETWFSGDIKLANIEYDDPAGVANFYKFDRYRNGVKTKQTFVDNDDLSDGRRTIATLFTGGDDDEEEDKLQTGDEVKIDMLCIDAMVYKYWYSLEQGATGNPQSATPANPVTNITGGALGYFSAHTCQTKIMRVP